MYIYIYVPGVLKNILYFKLYIQYMQLYAYMHVCMYLNRVYIYIHMCVYKDINVYTYLNVYIYVNDIHLNLFK